jgi:hypothetical protein
MQIVGTVIWIGIGLVQFWAFIDGLKIALDVGTIGAVLIAALVSWIPFVGTGAGIYGAVVGWGWWWGWAALLFLWPYALGLAAMIMEGVASTLRT